ncbi:hypothetical protein C8J55DRAFT_493787 [Lentinula edodes]|uniref:Uncharacterized protein n=1 Tax=Lentinula lateritia TaxID=40482 RepID=A0A9W9DE22_9AGAR|nr:hypothetical protein C8J55DRAFT_493787 [Lentinula edodes]
MYTLFMTDKCHFLAAESPYLSRDFYYIEISEFVENHSSGHSAERNFFHFRGEKSVKSFEDPVIETTEMKARAKVLETHLQKLAKRRVPKSRKASTTSSSTSSAGGK